MNAPARYWIKGFDDGPYYCFRVREDPPGRLLGSFVPDRDPPHPFDVVAMHLDDPRLTLAPPFEIGELSFFSPANPPAGFAAHLDNSRARHQPEPRA